MTQGWTRRMDLKSRYKHRGQSQIENGRKEQTEKLLRQTFSWCIIEIVDTFVATISMPIVRKKHTLRLQSELNLCIKVSCFCNFVKYKYILEGNGNRVGSWQGLIIIRWFEFLKLFLRRPMLSCKMARKIQNPNT